MPAPVARGHHRPFSNTANSPLRDYATQKRWIWKREGGRRKGRGPETFKAAARTDGSSGARATYMEKLKLNEYGTNICIMVFRL